jgi:hypothetical protein
MQTPSVGARQNGTASSYASAGAQRWRCWQQRRLRIQLAGSDLRLAYAASRP